MKTIVTSIAAASLLAALAAAQPQPSYSVIDLGTLGGTYSFGFGINNAGDVAGAAATPAQTDGFASTAFLWTKQKAITSLGVLGPPLFPECPTCKRASANSATGRAVRMTRPTSQTRLDILRTGLMQQVRLGRLCCDPDRNPLLARKVFCHAALRIGTTGTSETYLRKFRRACSLGGRNLW
jgi:hypothetical protein